MRVLLSSMELAKQVQDSYALLQQQEEVGSHVKEAQHGAQVVMAKIFTQIGSELQSVAWKESDAKSLLSDFRQLALGLPWAALPSSPFQFPLDAKDSPWKKLDDALLEVKEQRKKNDEDEFWEKVGASLLASKEQQSPDKKTIQPHQRLNLTSLFKGKVMPMLMAATAFILAWSSSADAWNMENVVLTPGQSCRLVVGNGFGGPCCLGSWVPGKGRCV